MAPSSPSPSGGPARTGNTFFENAEGRLLRSGEVGRSVLLVGAQLQRHASAIDQLGCEIVDHADLSGRLERARFQPIGLATLDLLHRRAHREDRRRYAGATA